MINRTVRKILLSKLNVTPQALSQRAMRIKSSYGPMSTEEAVYVIAHQEGIDLSRYLPIENIDRVRSLVPKDLPMLSARASTNVSKAKKNKRVTPSSYPLVKESMISKSVVIGHESFPQVFVLENSIRNLIVARLAKAYGSDWWNKAKIEKIRISVQKTINTEVSYPHREKRGLHPILYTNFADLKRIIQNELEYFKDVIIDYQWFAVEMDQVYMARNSLAHSVLLTEDDVLKIRLFYRDWSRLLGSAGIN